MKIVAMCELQGTLYVATEDTIYEKNYQGELIPLKFISEGDASKVRAKEVPF